jgi:hypothetical protein
MPSFASLLKKLEMWCYWSGYDIIIGGIDVEQAKDESEDHDQDLVNDHPTTMCEI